MAEEISITKESTAKNFMKANTEQRISPESVTVFIAGIDKIALDIVQKATILSKQDNRTTILDRDVKEALKTIGGGVDATPEGLFKVIEKMKAEEIGKIALLISQWVKENKIT